MNELKNLYAATPRDEPSAAVDQAILDAARRDAAAANESRRPSRFGWRAPLAAAAVLVLTASLTLLMKQELPEEVAPSASDAAVAPAPVEPQPSRERKRYAEPAAGKRADAQGKIAAPAAPPSLPAAPAPEQDAARALAITSDKAAPATLSAPSTAEASRAGAGGATALTAPRSAAQPASGSALAPAPLAPAMSRDSAGARPARLRALEEAPKDLSPQAWLERVAELRRQGRAQEAEESLAEFKKRFP